MMKATGIDSAIGHSPPAEFKFPACTASGVHLKQKDARKMQTTNFFQSFFDFEQYAKKAILTYQWATSVNIFSDLDKPAYPVFRCRYILASCVASAVLGLLFLLASLNLSVLNLARGSNRGKNAAKFLLGLLHDLSAALPKFTLENPALTKQTVVLLLSFSGSIVAICILIVVANLRKIPGVPYLRRWALTSLVFSTQLVHFSAICVVISLVLLAVRQYGLDMPKSETGSLLVLAIALLSSTLLTVLARRRAACAAAPVSGGNANLSILYSLSASACVALVLMSNAMWVSDWFEPNLSVMLSDSCGAPDKHACVVTILPKDVDGIVSLDSVRVQMAMEFADDYDRGPTQIMSASGDFRIIQNTDTPLPVEIGVERRAGVVDNLQFTCPQNLSEGAKLRKLIIKSYVASANTHTVDADDFDSIRTVQVKFSTNGDVMRMFRNAASGCALFP